MQNHMEIFSTTAKLFVWCLRLRVQEAQSLHWWRMGSKNLKYVNQYKYLGAVLDTELPDDKDIQRQLRHKYCAANKLRASSRDVQMQLKMYFFIPFVRPCMHDSYGGISESHACKDSVWPIILDAGLYTTCPGKRMLVVMTHQVQCNIPIFEAALRKNMHLFLERCRRFNNVTFACFDAFRLFIFFLILSTLQPHFTLWLSARKLQCLFVWRCACQNAFVLYLGLASLGIRVPLCSSAVPSEQIELRMHLQNWGSAYNAVTKRPVK